MKPKTLLKIAELLGYETILAKGSFSDNNVYVQYDGEKGCNHLFNPLTNNDQLVECIEYLLSKGWFFEKCEDTYLFCFDSEDDGYLEAQGKTLAEAVMAAMAEIVRGE